MQDTRTPTSTPAATDDAPAAVTATSWAVVDAIARLIAAASVYPPSHPRIAEIVEPVLGAVSQAGADGGAFALDIGAEPPERGGTAAAARLLRDLGALGIATIRIDAAVSVADLFAFARFVRQYAASHAADAGFRHLDLGSLAATIRLEERRFGAPTIATDPTAAETAAADTAAGDTGGKTAPAPVDAATLALVRRSVRAALAGASAPTDESWEVPETRLSPTAAGQAVAEAVRAWLDGLDGLGDQAGVATTAGRLIEGAEQVLPQILPGVAWGSVLASIRTAVDEHLNEGFRAEAQGNFDAKTVVPVEPAQKSGSDEELVRSIGEYTAGAVPIGTRLTEDRAEYLSILLHVHSARPADEPPAGAVRRLVGVLASPLAERERAVVAGWLCDIAAPDDPAAIDRLVSPVFPALHATGRRVVVDLLLDVCRAPNAALARPLWPHLARELVTGDDEGDVKRRKALIALLTSVPEARIRAETPRLAALLAAADGPIAVGVLSPPRSELRALYEALLQTPPAAGFARAVACAWIRHPPTGAAAGALLVLDADEERTHRFLLQLLREQYAPSSALFRLAAEYLVQALAALPQRRRGERWVAPALIALGRVPGADAAKTFRGVCAGRRFGLLPAWPAAAREAATQAMRMTPGERARRTAGEVSS